MFLDSNSGTFMLSQLRYSVQVLVPYGDDITWESGTFVGKQIGFGLPLFNVKRIYFIVFRPVFLVSTESLTKTQVRKIS